MYSFSTSLGLRPLQMAKFVCMNILLHLNFYKPIERKKKKKKWIYCLLYSGMDSDLFGYFEIEPFRYFFLDLNWPLEVSNTVKYCFLAA